MLLLTGPLNINCLMFKLTNYEQLSSGRMGLWSKDPLAGIGLVSNLNKLAKYLSYVFSDKCSLVFSVAIS